MDEPIGDLAGPSLCLLLLKRVDQFDRREEPYPLVVMFNGLNAERGGDVGVNGGVKTGHAAAQKSATMARA